MASAKKQTVNKADFKNNSRELIKTVAEKITTDPKFAYDANMQMSANGVIAKARKAGKTPEQIAKMNAAQLRKYL